MTPGLEITGEVINCWAYILNEEEKRRLKDNKAPRFFLYYSNAGKIYKTQFALSLNEKKEEMIAEFTKNIEKILQGAKLKSINDFKIILVPILHVGHFYVISVILEDKEIFIIDNSAKAVTNKQKYGDVPLKTRNALAGCLKSVGHKNANDIKGKKPVRMEMKWRTKNNGIDCGIFCIRHMECYKGEEAEKWDCGFHEEDEELAIIDQGKTHVRK
ncbi:putative Ulp1 protease family catalytic domain, papain-like cysteine peptidase superfamily [Helianthus anomalus]